MTAQEHFAAVDTSKGWYANRDHFEGAAVAIVAPWKALYDAQNADGKAEILAAARDYVGYLFVQADERYGWNFPRMDDTTEDYFLYAYGAAKAKAVLTGTLVGAFGLTRGPVGAVLEGATIAGR